MPLKTLTILESNQLLDELLREYGTTKQKLTGLRNYTMALLMLDSGLRVGEVAALLVTDLKTDNGPINTLVIRAEITKTKHQREIPTTQRLRRAIEKMSSNYWISPVYMPVQFAFYSAAFARPLSTRQIERIIGGASVTALGRNIHPHQLRHTFATRMMRLCSIRIVQELLGHANLSSTQIYTHPDQQAKTEAIEQLEASENNSNSHNISQVTH